VTMAVAAAPAAAAAAADALALLLVLLLSLLPLCHQQSLGAAPGVDLALATEMAMLAPLSVRTSLRLEKPGAGAAGTRGMKQRAL